MENLSRLHSDFPCTSSTAVCEAIAKEPRKVSDLCADPVVSFALKMPNPNLVHSSGDQLYNCVWLQPRGPNVMEFQVAGQHRPELNLLPRWASDRRRRRPSSTATTTTSCSGRGAPRRARTPWRAGPAPSRGPTPATCRTPPASAPTSPRTAQTGRWWLHGIVTNIAFREKMYYTVSDCNNNTNIYQGNPATMSSLSCLVLLSCLYS